MYTHCLCLLIIIIQDEHVFPGTSDHSKKDLIHLLKSIFLLLVPLNFAPIKTSSQITAYHSQLSHGKSPITSIGRPRVFFHIERIRRQRLWDLVDLRKTPGRLWRLSIFWFGKFCGRWGKGVMCGLQTVFCLEVFFFCWASLLEVLFFCWAFWSTKPVEVSSKLRVLWF